MSDIHIGKIVKMESGRGVAELYYHIPIVNRKTGIVLTPQSALSGLDQIEIDGFANGSLVEILTDIAINSNRTQAEIVTAIKVDWQNVKNEYNDRYTFEYKFYGLKLNVI